MVDQLVRKTIVFCEQKRLEIAGIEAEQFQELLVHEFRRQYNWTYVLVGVTRFELVTSTV